MPFIAVWRFRLGARQVWSRIRTIGIYPIIMRLPYRYLLFDLDGTLTDSAPGIIRCVRLALDGFGMSGLSEEVLRGFVGPPLVDSFRACGLSEEETAMAIARFRAEYEVRGIEENTLYPGIVELLTQLSDAGYRIAVATSKPTVMAERVLDRFALGRWFDAVCGGEPEGPCRTKAGVIRCAMERIGASSECRKVLMLGDRRHDMEGARMNGVDAVGVLWGYGSREELERWSPIRLADSPSDLIRFLI